MRRFRRLHRFPRPGALGLHHLIPGLLLLLQATTTAPSLAAQSPAPAPAPAPAPDHAELDEAIRQRVERNGGPAPSIVVDGERILASTELPRFYELRGFRPAWSEGGIPTARAGSLVAAVARADAEGLDPAHYHLPRIRALLDAGGTGGTGGAGWTVERLAGLDLLLTDAFLSYGAHLVGGRVDPVSMHPEWTARRREADLVATLDTALATGRVGATLEGLLPEHPGYYRLRSLLGRYRGIRAGGGLPEIPARTLQPGVRDPAVPVLRRWTRLTGDLEAAGGSAVRASSDSLRYDAGLEAAVRRVQTRLGLEPTGVVSFETSALMNVPIETRIRQLELNMERWRWLPRELGTRHVRVNIAAFEVEVFEGDTVGFSARVMVGQRFRKTPIFSDRIRYMVLNPTWTIPPGILENDKLPLIRANPAGYLREHRIRVLGPGGAELDPAAIDWAGVTGSTPLRLRMDPGPENPLGQVKFMFPNAHAVYLHDTPTRELFGRARRDFSSGCIRVDRPLELAAYLLRDDPSWTRARIDAALRNPAEQTVPLRSPVPVHILYWTAWAEPDGAVHFRDDIYDRDPALDAALREPPPPPPPTPGLSG